MQENNRLETPSIDEQRNIPYNNQTPNLDQVLNDEEIPIDILSHSCIRIVQLLTQKRSQTMKKVLEKFGRQIEIFNSIYQTYGQAVFEQAIDKLQYFKLKANQVLFHAGERGDKFYVVLRGSIGVYIMLPQTDANDSFKPTKVNVIHEGSAFGELALKHQNGLRTATIKAENSYVELAFMTADDYFSTLGGPAALSYEIKMQYLKNYPFFKNWAPREIISFSYHFQHMEYVRDNIVHRVNDQGKYLYFVNEGQFVLQLEINLPSKTKTTEIQEVQNLMNKFTNQVIKQIAIIGELQIFGEEIFFKRQDYHCTVRCHSNQGGLYRVLKTDIEKRFWDDVTQSLFRNYIRIRHQQRVERIKQFIQMIYQVENSENKIEKQAQRLFTTIQDKKKDIDNFLQKKSGEQILTFNFQLIEEDYKNLNSDDDENNNEDDSQKGRRTNNKNHSFSPPVQILALPMQPDAYQNQTNDNIRERRFSVAVVDDNMRSSQMMRTTDNFKGKPYQNSDSKLSFSILDKADKSYYEKKRINTTQTGFCQDHHDENCCCFVKHHQNGLIVGRKFEQIQKTVKELENIYGQFDKGVENARFYNENKFDLFQQGYFKFEAQKFGRNQLSQWDKQESNSSVIESFINCLEQNQTSQQNVDQMLKQTFNQKEFDFRQIQIQFDKLKLPVKNQTFRTFYLFNQQIKKSMKRDHEHKLQQRLKRFISPIKRQEIMLQQKLKLMGIDRQLSLMTGKVSPKQEIGSMLQENDREKKIRSFTCQQKLSLKNEKLNKLLVHHPQSPNFFLPLGSEASTRKFTLYDDNSFDNFNQKNEENTTFEDFLQNQSTQPDGFYSHNNTNMSFDTSEDFQIKGYSPSQKSKNFVKMNIQTEPCSPKIQPKIPLNMINYNSICRNEYVQ